MKNNRKKSRAYTLFELAIVTLILSIMIVGIMQGRRILLRAQLATARSLTINSPVNATKGLMLWYETTLETSFAPSEATNNVAVSTWYDISSSSRPTTKLNSTQSTANQRPRYIENAFNNGVPGIRFDGSNDTFIFNAAALVGSGYTIFLVEQKRRAAVGNNHIITIAGTASGSTGCCILIGWGGDTAFGLDKYNSGGVMASISFAYSAPIARLHTILMDPTSGSSYWLNGGTTRDASGGGRTTLPPPYVSAYLGKSCCGAYYGGDIGEVIIFTRALSNLERQAIEAYIGQKFSITIS